MATTYLELSNRTLRELNEVEMTSSNFSSSRGIQTAVKDFINKSIQEKILSNDFSWEECISGFEKKSDDTWFLNHKEVYRYGTKSIRSLDIKLDDKGRRLHIHCCLLLYRMKTSMFRTWAGPS